MNGSRSVLLSMLVVFALYGSGCSAGGSTDPLTGHSTTPINLQVTSPGGFPLSATGFYRGDTRSTLTGGTGLISFNVNLSGVVDSGSFSTGDALSLTWSPTLVWPAGNPGVDGTQFLTSDAFNGASETFQGIFNPVSRTWSGTFGRGAGYDEFTGPTGNSMSWAAGFVSEATSARPVERALTLEGQLFTAPGEGPAYRMGVQVYNDNSAVVSGTAPDGSAIMIVGKRVIIPRPGAKPSSPK